MKQFILILWVCGMLWGTACTREQLDPEKRTQREGLIGKWRLTYSSYYQSLDDKAPVIEFKNDGTFYSSEDASLRAYTYTPQDKLVTLKATGDKQEFSYRIFKLTSDTLGMDSDFCNIDGCPTIYIAID